MPHGVYNEITIKNGTAERKEIKKMSKTNEAYEKLNTLQKTYLKTQSALIKRAMENGLVEENERHRGKLRGYLECLQQMEIISGTDLKALYLYFITVK